MLRTPITPDFDHIPCDYHPLLRGASVYDSSSSPQARVLYIERGEGCYLKSAPKGSLAKEAALTQYFHEKGLAAEVLSYQSLEQDWLLTSRVPGEDCTHALYLAEPERLCDMLAQLLRRLHELPISDCPAPDRMQEYLDTVERGYRAGRFDPSYALDGWRFSSAEEAYRVITQNARLLKADVLIHGDYCLPNVMLDNWAFSGFIDLGAGGIANRHIDLFWGIWSLGFNLKTNAYTNRFLDAYGRENVNMNILRTISACETFG